MRYSLLLRMIQLVIIIMTDSLIWQKERMAICKITKANSTGLI